jgi:NitT/TauT family transport system substrate-binding protein
MTVTSGKDIRAMLNRRQWSTACAGLLLAAAGARARAQTAPARPAPFPPKLVDTRIVIAVDHRIALSNLPLTVADQLNYFREEGLDVELREFPDAVQALAAVQTRAAHVWCGAFGQLLNPSARGQAWQSFVVQARAPQVALGVSAKAQPGFRGPADLRGRRVGVRANDPLCLQLLQAVQQRAGLRTDELQVMPQANPLQALQALRFGQIDALCHTDPVITQLEQLGELRVVADTRNLRGTLDVFGGPVPVGCLSAPAEFIEQFPRLTQALTDAMVHALKWLQTAGPSDLIKTVPEGHFQGDRALYLAAVERAREAWTADGLMPRGGPETALRAGALAPLAPADLARSYTNTFAAKAKERFRA